MYEKVLSEIKTTEDAEIFNREADTLLDALFESREGSLESALKNEVRARIAGVLREELFKEGRDKEEFLKELKRKVEELETVSLTLAIEPTEGFLERIGHFIEEKVGDKVILNVSFNPQIVGGVVIVYKGLYRDFSFKKIFEKHFEERRDELMKIIDKKKLESNDA